MKKILITTSSGIVGQGVLRVLKGLSFEVFIIGTDSRFSESAIGFCDLVYKVPSGISKDYVKSIIEICQQNNVELIIPTHDLDLFCLSQHTDKLPPIACSNFEVIDLFFDKYKTYLRFSEIDVPFVETYLPSKYENQHQNTIVKPRNGYAWNELHLNPPNPREFSDEFVVQRLVEGIEFSTPFYVSNHQLIGHINIQEKYKNVNRVCVVTKEFDYLIVPILEILASKIDIRGVCEIEYIITKDGRIVPFEVNCRLSNTVPTRSAFGFNDVEILLNEYLYDKKLDKKLKTSTGSSVRILKDLVFNNVDVTKRLKKTKINLEI